MKMMYGPIGNCVPISDLNINITHSKVVGVIIGKTDSRGFPDRKNFGSERFTFSFTIKDSPEHFINVSAWGNEEYIHGLSSRFQIGDCVVIENPLVVTKDYEKEERFCPSTPSTYRLLVTETHSSIRICSDLETEARILPLFHMPIKDSRDFYSLGDITANGESLDGHIINILAAVQSIGEEKFFTKSDGRKGQRLEIKLFDDTGKSFPFVCWDKETIRLVQTLTQRETVLFIADARITFDSFRNCMTATATSKTIITLNPDTAEANQLYTCIRELLEAGGLDDQDILSGDDVQYKSLDSISDVLTVEKLKARSQEHAEVFHCIIFGFITSLELNSSISKVIHNFSTSAKCKFRINEESQTCSNDACPNQGQQLQATEGFDLLVDISDHTGTVQSCNLTGTVAEKTLGCKVFPSARSRSGMRASILSCALADPVEVKQNFASFVV
uniref:Meiosis-specific with OB domain-containing protein-like n=1 Tax=Sinocyclocheilus rhinocerous TaxID=307959 RepID=A0A673J2D2_9TELE